jgi:hypothetical protein
MFVDPFLVKSQEILLDQQLKRHSVSVEPPAIVTVADAVASLGTSATQMAALQSSPVVTADGRRFGSKAEYEASLTAPKTTVRAVGAGLSVQIGSRLFNINADMATEAACKSINEIFVANPGTVTFYSNGTVVQTPTWYTPVSGFTQATIVPSVGGNNMWSRQNTQMAYTPMYVMPAAPGGGTPARGYSGATSYNGGQPPLFGASFGLSGPFGGGFRMSGGVGGCSTGG